MKSIIDKLILLYQNNKGLIFTILKYGVIIVVTSLLVRGLCNPPTPLPVIDNNIEEVKTLRDRNNNLVAVIEQKSIEIVEKSHIVDSLAHALKLKPKHIKGLDREVTVLDTVWRDSIIYISGPDSTVISRRDRWVSILAVAKPNERYIDFRLAPDTLTRVKVVKNPIFGRETTQNYLIHSNPYFKTTHGDSYEERQKRAIFNLSVSIGYDPFQRRFFGGPTIGVPIKTFYSKK